MSAAIRLLFLETLKKEGHTIVPSSPTIPHEDPSLLFTNAGMNQFKDLFLGGELRGFSSAASAQKCIRAGGKHNDLENVGHTARHLTFFEMLGFFSFGAYFKEKAIELAWSITRNLFKFPEDKLWASVFLEDDEAYLMWQKYLPTTRIVKMGKEDNFWSMGATGPCGPCSELYFDQGPSFGNATSPLDDIEGRRFIEFWNLVFMEYAQDETGKKQPLPIKCVDTGLGLERTLALMKGLPHVFLTDILFTIIKKISDLTSIPYISTEKDAASFHVIADHIRTLSFAIADGAQPGNIDRGYVLRKILRRAVQYGSNLGMREPFLAQLVPSLVEASGPTFPELSAAQKRIQEILTVEETNFLNTLSRGGSLLKKVISDAQNSDKHLIDGHSAFRLKDTYGLPLEEIVLLAKDHNLTIDLPAYQQCEEHAKTLSKEAHKHKSTNTHPPIAAIHLPPAITDTKFTGYSDTEGPQPSKVLFLIKAEQPVQALEVGDEGLCIIDSTPFYAEKGGQVGDQGTLHTETLLAEVLSTQSGPHNTILHHVRVKAGHLQKDSLIQASVDKDRRNAIACHHTATHLLHLVLQEVLGPHIRQAGSLVQKNRLRFDFNHHKAISQEEIISIEKRVNQLVRSNAPVKTYEMTLQEASTQQDIKQFFGEKYGSTVRVVESGPSKELCGGTHVSSLGCIGLFRIIKESGIAMGTRRIEAVCGDFAETFVYQNEQTLHQVTQLLKTTPPQVIQKLEDLIELSATQKKSIVAQNTELLKQKASSFEQDVEVGTVGRFLIAIAPCSSSTLIEFATLLDKMYNLDIIILFVQENENAHLHVQVKKDCQKNHKVSAKQIALQLLTTLQGKGGGNMDIARGKGLSSYIKDAIKQAKEIVLHL